MLFYDIEKKDILRLAVLNTNDFIATFGIKDARDLPAHRVECVSSTSVGFSVSL